MENQDKKTFFRSFISIVNKNSITRIITIITFLSILILIYGFFYARFEVPFPDENLPVFPKEQYQDASDVFKDEKQISIIGLEQFNSAFEHLWSSDKIFTNPLNEISNYLSREYQNKLVLFRSFEKSFFSPTIQNKYDQIKNRLNNELDSLNSLTVTSYWDRNKISEIQRDLRNLEAMKEMTLNFKVESQVTFPYSNKNEIFNFTMGQFGYLTTGNKANSFVYKSADYKSKPLYPVVNSKMIERSGLKITSEDKELLKNDDRKLENIVAEDFKKFKEIYNKSYDEISSYVSIQRSNVRSAFYEKWFSILILVISTILVQFLLFKYAAILRRKGLPRKSTYQVYFSTNTTSLILRWIAITITYLGILYLGLLLIIKIFTLDYSVIYLIRPIGVWLSIISPIISGLSIVVITWLFVLLSEFICFLSNCYHISFTKVYDDSKSIHKQDGAEISL